MDSALLPEQSLVLSPPFEASPDDIRRVMGSLEVRKAAGTDCISSRLLHFCKNELRVVLSNLFNWSIQSSHVPKCFKRLIIIHVPKRSPVTCDSGYRPVAITSIVMKCFETFIREIHSTPIAPFLDLFQFAYKAKRSIDDAICWALFMESQFLGRPIPNYCRLVFVDYSSAFNTISSCKLFLKLTALDLDPSLCGWILFDFLLNRSFSTINPATSNRKYPSFY